MPSGIQEYVPLGDDEAIVVTRGVDVSGGGQVDWVGSDSVAAGDRRADQHAGASPFKSALAATVLFASPVAVGAGSWLDLESDSSVTSIGFAVGDGFATSAMSIDLLEEISDVKAQSSSRSVRLRVKRVKSGGLSRKLD